LKSGISQFFFIRRGVHFTVKFIALQNMYLLMMKSSLLMLMVQALSVSPSKLYPDKTREKRIAGGSVVNPEFKYPYQVFYRPGGDYVCGGTIINKNHVITADHCINTDQPHSLHYVIVGHHRVNRKDAFGSNREAIFGSNLILVKRFIKRRDRKDIAILRLERDIQLSERAKPACLPGKISQNFIGRNAVVSGWGDTTRYAPEDERPARVPSELLKAATVKVLNPSSSLCQRARADRDDMLCAYNEGHDACQGDSGGPLTLQENGRFVLIGVVSGGSGCGAKGHTGTYTRVAYFDSWIRDNVGQVCTSKTTNRPTNYQQNTLWPNTPKPSAFWPNNPRPNTPKPSAFRPNTLRPNTPQPSVFRPNSSFNVCKYSVYCK